MRSKVLMKDNTYQGKNDLNVKVLKMSLFIRKHVRAKNTPLKSHFYIGVYIFFLFLVQNIDSGYSARPF